ncbi:hypothetical protein PAPYR_2375 [Paratrimastix pyriformis]|uniref:TmcB/TmcC TPR repeats domain-containing protein n=1 Tax=Paratrimastix pyriformis TaxID=342808 RepID=A0ABQ8UQ82_9EUKA|nr:hypothetical protein PAPYR_2375 [Paratrimastix pyriformis]
MKEACIFKNLVFNCPFSPVFGLYYAMSKDQSESFKIINLGNIALQYIQMIAISFSGVQWPLGVAETVVRTAFSIFDLSISSTTALSMCLPPHFASPHPPPPIKDIVMSLAGLATIIALVNALVTMLFFRHNKSVPLTPLKILRVLTISLVSYLYMPFVGFFMGVLDCYYLGSGDPTHATLGVQCMAVPHLVFWIISLVILVIFVPVSQFTSLFLNNNDPKKGGMLARPNGRVDFVVVRRSPPGIPEEEEGLLVKFCISTVTKLLTQYHEIRAGVSIAGYLGLAGWVLLSQPYYTARGNALYSVLYSTTGLSCIFATVAPTVSISNAGATAGFWVAYFLAMPITGAAAVFLSHARTRQLWALPRSGKLPDFFTRQLADGLRFPRLPSSGSLQPVAPGGGPAAANAYRPPKFRSAARLERAVRFLQEKQYRKQKDYVAYADFLYTEAFRKQRNNPSLHLSYAIFLLTYRKNFPRCMQQLQQARQCYPAFDERYAIFVKAKDWEQQTSTIGDLRSAHVMSVFTFKRHFSMAQKYHDDAKAALRDFCEALLAAQPDQGRIIDLTTTIVDSEAKAREYYELLLESHSNSVQVLRAYGSLLRDIYHDEDAAKVLLSRADLIEDDQSVAESQSASGSSQGQPGGPGTPPAQQANAKHQKEAAKKRNRKKLGELKLATRKQNLLPRFVLRLSLVHLACLAAIVVSTVFALYSIGEVATTMDGLDSLLHLDTTCAAIAINAKVRSRAPARSDGPQRRPPAGQRNPCPRRDGQPGLTTHLFGGAPSLGAGTVLLSVAEARASLVAAAFQLRTMQSHDKDLHTVGLVTFNGTNIAQQTLSDSLRGVLDRYAQYALDLAAQPLGSDVFQAGAQFLVANQPTGLQEHIKRAGLIFGDYVKLWVLAVESVIIVLDALAGIFMSLLLLVLYLSTGAVLTKGREAALVRVLSYPKAAVRRMLNEMTAEPLDEAAAGGDSPPPKSRRPSAAGTPPPDTLLLPPPDAPLLDGGPASGLDISLVSSAASPPYLGPQQQLPPPPPVHDPMPQPIGPSARPPALGRLGPATSTGLPQRQLHSPRQLGPSPIPSSLSPQSDRAEADLATHQAPSPASSHGRPPSTPLLQHDDRDGAAPSPPSGWEGAGAGGGAQAVLTEWMVVSHGAPSSESGPEATPGPAEAPLPPGTTGAALPPFLPPLPPPQRQPDQPEARGAPGAASSPIPILPPLPSGVSTAAPPDLAPPPAEPLEEAATQPPQQWAAGTPDPMSRSLSAGDFAPAMALPSGMSDLVEPEPPDLGLPLLPAAPSGSAGAAGAASRYQVPPPPGGPSTQPPLAAGPPLLARRSSSAQSCAAKCPEKVAQAGACCLALKRALTLPKVVRLRIFTGVWIMLLLLILSAIFTAHAQDAVSAVGHPLALCGQQETQAAVVRLLATQLLFNSSLPLLDNPANPAATSPVWRDLSHLSNDRAALQRLLAGQADYLERIGYRLLYGTGASNATGDRTIDARFFEHTSGDLQAREVLLHVPQACLMRNASDCVAGRIRGLDGTLVGLAPLLARYLDAARQLSALPPGELTPTNPYFEFLFSAGRYDLHDGMQQWTDSFLDQSRVDRGNAMIMLIGWLSVDIVALLFSFVVVLLPTKPLLWAEAHKTFKMLELFPESDQLGPLAQIVEWRPAYQTGQPLMDANHRALVELAGRLMEALATDEERELWESFTATFAAEERLMREHSFPRRRAHRHEHFATLAGLKQAMEAMAHEATDDGVMVQSLVQSWLTGHVIRADREFGQFLARRDAAAAIAP